MFEGSLADFRVIIWALGIAGINGYNCLLHGCYSGLKVLGVGVANKLLLSSLQDVIFKL